MGQELCKQFKNIELQDRQSELIEFVLCLTRGRHLSHIAAHFSRAEICSTPLLVLHCRVHFWARTSDRINMCLLNLCLPSVAPLYNLVYQCWPKRYRPQGCSQGTYKWCVWTHKQKQNVETLLFWLVSEPHTLALNEMEPLENKNFAENLKGSQHVTYLGFQFWTFFNKVVTLSWFEHKSFYGDLSFEHLYKSVGKLERDDTSYREGEQSVDLLFEIFILIL